MFDVDFDCWVCLLHGFSGVWVGFAFVEFDVCVCYLFGLR